MKNRFVSLFIAVTMLTISSAVGVILAIIIFTALNKAASYAVNEVKQEESRTQAAQNTQEDYPYEVLDADTGKRAGSYPHFEEALADARTGSNRIITYHKEIVWASQYELPASMHITDVPLIGQFPELPRGCEVTSLAMLLRFHDEDADKMTLAEEVDKVPFKENGLRGNPYDGFVGSMYTFNDPGLGVFHGPITRLAKDYMGDRVADLTGSDFDEVLYQVAMGRPVWVIVTSTYNIVPESGWQTWHTASGEVDITYSQHSVVITGFDEHYIYMNDPFLRHQKVSKDNFRKGWEQYGSQAMTIF